MARHHFSTYCIFLHFANNDTIDKQDMNRDSLGKICDFLNLIKMQCTAVFQPGQDVCVDKSLILLKGCLAFKQFIRTKQTRFRIKIFQWYTHNGILLDFIVYHGNMSQELLTTTEQEMLISEQIPIMLMQRLLNKGHQLFIDSYYTSPRLDQYFYRATLC